MTGRLPMSLRLLCSTQVSLIHAHNLPDHSVVNHPLSSDDRFDTLPLSVIGFRPLPERSGFRHCIAGSSQTAGRITFVILRTDRSPPVAPHPASRTDAVTVGYRPESACLKGTFTPLIVCAFRRTMPRPCVAEVHAAGYRARRRTPGCRDLASRRFTLLATERVAELLDAATLRRGGSRWGDENCSNKAQDSDPIFVPPRKLTNKIGHFHNAEQKWDHL